jgi:hypothetical protein
VWDSKKIILGALGMQKEVSTNGQDKDNPTRPEVSRADWERPALRRLAASGAEAGARTTPDMGGGRS